MYQREHDVLFASIRSGKPKNDDLNLATSTLLAIMGRHAAYTGQQVTWDQALNSAGEPGAEAGRLEREARSARPGAARAVDGDLVSSSEAASLGSPRDGPRWPWRGPLLSSLNKLTSAIDPQQLAAVQRIRTRIEERAEQEHQRCARGLHRHHPEYDGHLRRWRRCPPASS